MITPDNGRLSGVIIPEDITVNNDAGRCGAVVNYTPPTCSQTLTQTGSNSINGGNYHNGYATQHLRAYDLPASGITNGFTVSSVKFGVYSAFEASDSTPLTINVYQCDPLTSLSYANFTLVGTEDFYLSNQSSNMFNQPISAVIPAGFGMIVEIVENSNNFGIGFTNSPQTATSYFYRPCDPSPSIREDLFGSHYIINAKGGSGQPITQTAGLPSGSVFPVGITTNIFKAGETTVCSFTITVVSDLTATIPDVKALSKGVEANTVYQGYTPAS